MGLFKILRKKQYTHDEKVSQAYSCYKVDMVEKVFPGGKTQASNIIMSLARIYGLNLESCDATMYYNILQIYSGILIRKVITQSADEHIISIIQSRHGALIKNEIFAQKTLAYVIINMKNNEFVLENDEDMSILDVMVNLLCQVEDTAKKNSEAEKENTEDPEYGLVPNKPIFTRGVNESKKYLDMLRTPSGEKLLWKRRGSMVVHGINGMVDIYDSKLQSGEVYITVYINMYGSANTKKVPKGFL